MKGAWPTTPDLRDGGFLRILLMWTARGSVGGRVTVPEGGIEEGVKRMRFRRREEEAWN